MLQNNNNESEITNSIDDKKYLTHRQKLRRQAKANRYYYEQFHARKLENSSKEPGYFANSSKTDTIKSASNKTVDLSTTLEEGEIRTDMEEDDNDDCIIIENKQPTIVIDDDDDKDDVNVTITPINVDDKENSIFTPGFLSINQLIKRANERDNSININQLAAAKPVILNASLTASSTASSTVTTANANAIKPVYMDIEEKFLSEQQNLTINESEIIILDETVCDGDNSITDVEKTINENDNSVIFVSETKISNKCPDFIPLESLDVPNPIKFSEITQNNNNNIRTLYTKQQQQKIDEYNANTYNPDAHTVKNPGKRLVLIDASNVAFHHGRNKYFSVKGIQICIDYFVKLGHNVKAVLPHYRMKRYKSTDPEALKKLFDDDFLVLTPSKTLSNGVTCSSYDDRCLLQTALTLDAAIVSNDNYRDLAKECLEFQRIIKSQVISFMWCGDVLVLPKDPYGRVGPDLHTILNRT